jgi:hypothetical protein
MIAVVCRQLVPIARNNNNNNNNNDNNRKEGRKEERRKRRKYIYIANVKIRRKKKESD